MKTSDNFDQNTTSQTHANLVQINRERKFSLNLEKALEKKILATKREVQFEYHQTGGGIVGNADAITYELVKNAIAYYYDNMINSTRRVEITKDNDKKRSQPKHCLKYMMKINISTHLLCITQSVSF